MIPLKFAFGVGKNWHIINKDFFYGIHFYNSLIFVLLCKILEDLPFEIVKVSQLSIY
jgi:hypothetical protein